MMDAADDSATLDMESADLEAAASYQANGKMTRSLITEAARAVEKKYFGQTKQQLKSLMYLGIAFVVTSAFFAVMGGIFWTMSWKGWVSLYLMIAAIFLLIADKWDASLTFLGVTLLLILFQIITVAEALKGFANEAVATIAVLFIVAAAVEETNMLEWVSARVLGKPKNTYTALLRFLPVVVVLSAFTNNTPIVLIFLRVLQSWSVRSNLPLTRLLMPLSFASILGGTCTIIGTSTNLVVQGLAGDSVDLGFFDVAILGVPLAVIGVVYMIFMAKFLLPESSAKCDYMPLAAGMHFVPAESVVIGKTAQQAGMLDLPGTILVTVKREGNIGNATELIADAALFQEVGAEEPLQAGDLCYFVGMAECVSEIDNLSRCEEDRGVRVTVFECFVQRNQGEIAVAEFEQHFDCRILAINREGVTLKGEKIDQVHRGDVVIVEASYAFLHHSRASQFVSISEVKVQKMKEQGRLLSIVQPWVILVLVVAMVVLAVFFDLLFAFAGVVSIVAVMLRVITWNQALASIQGSLLLLIACSFALAIALEKTGVAANIARGLAFIFRPGGTYTQLMGIFLATTLLTNVISNAAAASVMYPIVVSMVKDTGLSLKAALFTLMCSASFAFLTPIGYQTNLFVQRAGGYTWGNFFYFGGPLTLLCLLITPLISMFAWPAAPGPILNVTHAMMQ